MRRTITILLLALLLLTAVLCSNYLDTHYTREVIVQEVTSHEVVVEDKQGNLWVFCGEGYREGQALRIVMFDNRTSGITDDQVVKVK